MLLGHNDSLLEAIAAVNTAKKSISNRNTSNGTCSFDKQIDMKVP